MKPIPSTSQIIEALLSAYRQGAFPMADPDTGTVGFYLAPQRGIFPIEPSDPLGAFHVPRSLHRRLNSGWFEIRCDSAFPDVIAGCAAPRPDDPETWINDDLTQWFTLLHKAGFAHSVEAWRTDHLTAERTLVGGIYGLAIGGAFFGESMFSRPRPRRAGGTRHPLDGTDASKVCLVNLMNHVRRRGYMLFDTQLLNPHLARFGCVEVSHAEYMRRLEAAIDAPVAWGRFS